MSQSINGFVTSQHLEGRHSLLSFAYSTVWEDDGTVHCQKQTRPVAFLLAPPPNRNPVLGEILNSPFFKKVPTPWHMSGSPHAAANPRRRLPSPPLARERVVVAATAVEAASAAAWTSPSSSESGHWALATCAAA